MALDHPMVVRIYVAALGLIAGAWAVRMLVTGRGRDRWGRIAEIDNPFRFALSVAGVALIALLGLLFAAGLM